MAMHMVRTGSAAVVGVASGVLSSDRVLPFHIGTTPVSWGTVAEGVALLGGVVMQFAMPFTAPNMVDGLVDGGAALLVARGAKYAMNKWGTPAAAMYAGAYGALGASRISPQLVGAGVGRGQVGTIHGVVKSHI